MRIASRNPRDSFARRVADRLLRSRDMKHPVIAVALASLLSACGKDEPPKEAKNDDQKEKKDEKKDEKKVEKKDEKPEPAKKAEAPKIAIDPEIAKRAKDIAASCEIDEKAMRVSSCKGSEEYAVYDYAAKNEVAGVYESLAELALTEGAKDKKLFAAIVGTWNKLRDRDLQLKASTPAAAERVLALYALVPGSVERFGYAAPIAITAGKRTELLAALAKLEPASELRQASMNYLLDFGGVAALPDVQAAYKAAADEQRYGLVWSVGIAMYRSGVDDATRTTLCDWAKQVAADPATGERAFGGAIDSLGRCKGTYLDDGLAAIEARLTAGKPTSEIASGLHHMCWAEGMVGAKPNGSPAQCERALGLLVKATAKPDGLPADTVQTAIFSLGAVAKNAGLQAKAKPALAALSAHKDKAIAGAAKQALTGL
jgi:hypothetical protein